MRQARSTLLNLVLLAILMLVLLFGTVPSWSRFRELKAEAQWLFANLKQQKVERKRHKRLREEYEQLLEHLGKPIAQVQAGAFTSRFSREMDGICGASRILLDTFQPLEHEANENDGYVKFVAQITAKGSISALKEMLLRIRSSVPPIEIERLSISGIGESAELVSVQMQVSWYRLLGEELKRTPQRKVPARGRQEK